MSQKRRTAQRTRLIAITRQRFKTFRRVQADANFPSCRRCTTCCNIDVHRLDSAIPEGIDGMLIVVKKPRLPACPTTGRKPRPCVLPLAGESDPHPVCQVWAARTYTGDSRRDRAPRGGPPAVWSVPRRPMVVDS